MRTQQFVIGLNDFQFIVPNQLTLIQACLHNKVDVPRFCFHEKLSIAGNCRMCLVEDLKQAKPVVACAVNVLGSMSIYTNTIKVRKARESVLEFLLVNHPLDCPICDQGGECDLQDQSLIFGSDRGRFYEFKRSVEDKDCGPFIKTIMNRCIHCTRCVRFSNEVAGVENLGITGRGGAMEIGFYIENMVDSELSGNIIDLCPVGALTSKPSAFVSRSWELRSYCTIDVLDEMHSNIRVDVRGTRIMRILPRINENINGDWISDRARFSYDAFKQQRLNNPVIVFANKYINVSWEKVLNFVSSTLISANCRLAPVAYIGNYLDLESLYSLKRFFCLSGSSYFVSSGAALPSDIEVSYLFNTPINSLHRADICLFLDVNLRMQFPLLNARVRGIVVNNGLPVYVLGYYSNFNYYVKHVSITSQVLLDILEGSHWLSTKFSKTFSRNPALFVKSTNFASSTLLCALIRFTNIIADS
jgi:NADH dehydrogenase (ubiquinone) Fe-S protein 1